MPGGADFGQCAETITLSRPISRFFAIAPIPSPAPCSGSGSRNKISSCDFAWSLAASSGSDNTSARRRSICARRVADTLRINSVEGTGGTESAPAPYANRALTVDPVSDCLLSEPGARGLTVASVRSVEELAFGCTPWKYPSFSVEGTDGTGGTSVSEMSMLALCPGGAETLSVGTGSYSQRGGTVRALAIACSQSSFSRWHAAASSSLCPVAWKMRWNEHGRRAAQRKQITCQSSK